MADISIATVETVVNDVIGKVAAHDAQVSRIQNDPRLAPQAKAQDIAKLEAAYTPVIDAQRGACEAMLDTTWRAADQQLAGLNEAALPHLSGAAEWQEAAARAQFIQEDLADSPGRAADMLRRAVATKDTIGQMLIIRYAPQALQGNRQALRDFTATVGELYPIDSKRAGKLRADLIRLSELRDALPTTPGRLLDLSQRFHLLG